MSTFSHMFHSLSVKFFLLDLVAVAHTLTQGGWQFWQLGISEDL